MSLGSKKQVGVSMWALLVIVVVTIFIAMFAWNITPKYLDHHLYIKKIVSDEIAKQNTTGKFNQKAFYEGVGKRLRVNSIQLDDIQQQIAVKKIDGKRFVLIDYENRSTLVYNIETVIHFTEKYEIQ